jgi:hypothetical protein
MPPSRVFFEFKIFHISTLHLQLPYRLVCLPLAFLGRFPGTASPRHLCIVRINSALYQRCVIVRYHCGGWPEEVNSCALNSYMVYL